MNWELERETWGQAKRCRPGPSPMLAGGLHKKPPWANFPLVQGEGSRQGCLSACARGAENFLLRDPRPRKSPRHWDKFLLPVWKNQWQEWRDWEESVIWKSRPSTNSGGHPSRPEHPIPLDRESQVNWPQDHVGMELSHQISYTQDLWAGAISNESGVRPPLETAPQKAPESDTPWCESWLCHLLAWWPSLTYITSLCLTQLPHQWDRQTNINYPHGIVGRAKGNNTCEAFSRERRPIHFPSSLFPAL